MGEGFSANFPRTMAQRIFGTNSSFYVKQCTMRKVYFLFFKSFLLVLAKL